jgi:hypothetical protein
MLRSVAAPLLLLIGILFQGEGCTLPINWAVQPTLPPPPSIAAHDEEAYSALLEDALLDEGDVPLPNVTRTVSHGWALIRPQPQYFAGFQDGGGRWVARGIWRQPSPDNSAGSFPPATEHAFLNEELLLFATDEEAQAFFAAHPHPLPENYLRPPEVLDFAADTHLFAEAPSPEPNTVPVRNLQLRSLVGPIVIQVFLTLHQDRDDWQEVTHQLLETARTRAQEALVAADE